MGIALAILVILGLCIVFLVIDTDTPAQKRQKEKFIKEQRYEARRQYSAYEGYGATFQEHAWAKKGLETPPGTMLYWKKTMPNFSNPVKLESVVDTLKCPLRTDYGATRKFATRVAFKIKDNYGDFHSYVPQVDK